MREPVPTTHPPSRANTPNTTAPRFNIVSPPEKIRLLRKCQRFRRRFVPRSRQGTPGASSLTPPSTSSTTSSSSDSIEQSVPSNSSSRPSSTAVVAGSLRVDQGRTWILDAGGRASPATRCSSHPWPCLLILEPALPRSRGERWFRSKRCRQKNFPTADSDRPDDLSGWAREVADHLKRSISANRGLDRVRPPTTFAQLLPLSRFDTPPFDKQTLEQAVASDMWPRN